jgi:3-isopropylmalate/(R)-2-methylmalate dehydratase large subunit
MGMTIAEKILSRASGRSKVEPGEIVMAKIDRTRIVDNKAPILLSALKELGVKKIWDPDRVVLPIEHQVPPSSQADADAYVACRQLAKEYSIKNFYEMGRHGVCHTLFIEKGFARPGELVAAHDSHTCTYGGLNVASRGIGAIEMIHVLVKGTLWFKVPETIRFELVGTLPDLTFAKDIVLYIAGKYGTDVGLYKSIEFVGEAAEQLSIWSRVTISNMGIELGAKFALFEADEKTIQYVKERTDEPFEPVKSDSDANFSASYSIDISSLGPQVACPHDISNVKPVEEIEGLPINQCFIGSCTNGSIEDLRVACNFIKGRKVHPETRLIVIPGSMEIYLQALREGLLEAFIEAGAIVDGPTCGPCGGGGKGLLGKGERGISSTNRNFKGRQGSPDAEVYLASPATVAASAVAGKITDPRKAV